MLKWADFYTCVCTLCGARCRVEERTRATTIGETDPRASEFVALTREEEEHGLYREVSKIGLRLYWTALLARHGLTYEAHRLIVAPRLAAGVPEEIPAGQPAEIVARHRTAIKRYDLSRPVKRLLERGLLKAGDTFFDYGCGHGMDVEALTHATTRRTGCYHGGQAAPAARTRQRANT